MRRLISQTSVGKKIANKNIIRPTVPEQLVKDKYEPYTPPLKTPFKHRRVTRNNRSRHKRSKHRGSIEITYFFKDSVVDLFSPFGLTTTELYFW